MTINSYKTLAEAHTDGKTIFTPFRKLPAIATTAGVWFDLSLAPGTPKPNYYTGAELTATTLSGNNGIYHGQAVAPENKFLAELCVSTVAAALAPSTFWLCDYLLFYPLVDMDNTDVQELDNTVTLPRYATGDGVQAFLVATNPYIGGASYTINYTNSDGVAGRVSQTATCNTATTIATLVSGGSVGASRFAPFIPLQSGDKGIRSVQSVTFGAPNGGLAALVLCKPLANNYVREITAPNEKCYPINSAAPPVIQDGAYLNFLILPNGSFAGQIVTGHITTAWG